MPMQEPTRKFLSSLRTNPSIRSEIKAPFGKTLLYAGSGKWQQIKWIKDFDQQRIEWLSDFDTAVREKKILPEILVDVKTPGQPFPNLLAWAEDLDKLIPKKENGWFAWRSLSGLFAANAKGPVSFLVGSGISKAEKVFAATEVAVLARNPNVDPITKDALAYYQRCIQTKTADINFGFIHG